MQYLPFTPNEYNCDIITIQAPMEVIDKINIFSQMMYQARVPSTNRSKQISERVEKTLRLVG